MGLFNTQGFLSKLDIVGGEEIFLLVCSYKHKPYKYSKPTFPGCKGTYTQEPGSDDTNYGDMIPISIPIFGKYDDYGRIKEIKRDEGVEALETLLGDDIETILRIIFDISEDRDIKEEEIKKYMGYRRKLGYTPYFDTQEVNEYLQSTGIGKQITQEQWIDWYMEESTQNKELICVIDHYWVYETLSELYPDVKNFPFMGEGYRVYNDKIKVSESGMKKFYSLCYYLCRNYLLITENLWTGQLGSDWEKIRLFTDRKLKFINSKCSCGLQ